MAINTYFLRCLVTTDYNMQASEETINRLIANYGSHIKIHGYTIESITVLYNTIKDSELADNDYLIVVNASRVDEDPFFLISLSFSINSSLSIFAKSS